MRLLRRRKISRYEKVVFSMRNAIAKLLIKLRKIYVLYKT